MANLLNPTAIIFINSNISTGVIEKLTKQLFIDQIITANEFDGYVALDGYYPDEQHGLDKRILVLRDLLDYTNRDMADIVLCYSKGMIYVEESKLGPRGKTLRLQDLYLLSLYKP